MAYPTDTEIDNVFPDNTNGDIGADDMRAFQKTMTAAGKDYAAMTENVPTVFPPAAHNHPISEVTNLQAALDGKAAASHTHAIGDVTGLQPALDGKAPAAHTHATSEVTGLDATLQTMTDATTDLETQMGGLTLAVVASLPGTPDEDTIYFVTG